MRVPILDGQPHSAEVLADPLGTCDCMPVACARARTRRGVTLFRHGDAVKAAQDAKAFSSAASARPAVSDAIDTPDHVTRRALVDSQRAFTLIAALQRRVRGVACAGVAARGATVHALVRPGIPFAVRAQTAWPGWREFEDGVLAWRVDNDAATRSGDGVPSAPLDAAFDEGVRAPLRRHRERCLAVPTDPTSVPRVATRHGWPLAEADMPSVQSNSSARDLASVAADIGVVDWCFATRADAQQGSRAHDEGLASTIDEMLRVDTRSRVHGRVTTRAACIGECEVTAGNRVDLNWSSADRDEAVCGDRCACRAGDDALRNPVYGSCIDACPGRPLATMELVIVACALLPATPGIGPASDAMPVRETCRLDGWQRMPLHGAMQHLASKRGSRQ